MIQKVLISGGHEVGGLDSFSKSLSKGFIEYGINAETVTTFGMLCRISELRDTKILKILSTSAVFLAPICRNAICVSHGIPRLDSQPLLTFISIILSFRLFSYKKNIVCVSNYAAVHLQAIFNVNINAVIRNPIDPLFVADDTRSKLPNREKRNIISYIGRLHKCKNIDILLPIMLEFSKLHPELHVVIAGDGPLLDQLKFKYESKGVEFLGRINKNKVKELLINTKIFVSGCTTEALGISYIEALSQGCSVVMPLSGGGLEIVNELDSSPIYCFSLDFSKVSILDSLEKSYYSEMLFEDIDHYRARTVAEKYLKIST